MSNLIERVGYKMNWYVQWPRNKMAFVDHGNVSRIFATLTDGLTDAGLIAVEDKLLRAGYWPRYDEILGLYRWWKWAGVGVKYDLLGEHADRRTAALLAIDAMETP